MQITSTQLEEAKKFQKQIYDLLGHEPILPEDEYLFSWYYVFLASCDEKEIKSIKKVNEIWFKFFSFISFHLNNSSPYYSDLLPVLQELYKNTESSLFCFQFLQFNSSLSLLRVVYEGVIKILAISLNSRYVPYKNFGNSVDELSSIFLRKYGFDFLWSGQIFISSNQHCVIKKLYQELSDYIHANPQISSDLLFQEDYINNELGKKEQVLSYHREVIRTLLMLLALSFPDILYKYNDTSLGTSDITRTTTNGLNWGCDMILFYNKLLHVNTLKSLVDYTKNHFNPDDLGKLNLSLLFLSISDYTEAERLLLDFKSSFKSADNPQYFLFLCALYLSTKNEIEFNKYVPEITKLPPNFISDFESLFKTIGFISEYAFLLSKIKGC